MVNTAAPPPSAERGAALTSMLGAALRGVPCTVEGFDGGQRPLPVPRWSQHAGDSDRALLRHCIGPALDIGCGPGRMSGYLAWRGVQVLGIDVIGEAVGQTRARGASAVLRDVFEPVPGEGQWASALLADGNIGIGGDPVALLSRVAEIVAPGGTAVVDVAPPGSGLWTPTLRLHCAGVSSESFAWSVLGLEALTGVAHRAGWSPAGLHMHHGRWFGVLRNTRDGP